MGRTGGIALRWWNGRKATARTTADPSLRLKNGYAQDDTLMVGVRECILTSRNARVPSASSGRAFVVSQVSKRRRPGAPIGGGRMGEK